METVYLKFISLLTSDLHYFMVRGFIFTYIA